MWPAFHAYWVVSSSLHAGQICMFILFFVCRFSGIPSDLLISFCPHQDRYFVGPGVGPNCLQRLSATSGVAGCDQCRRL